MSERPKPSQPLPPAPRPEGQDETCAYEEAKVNTGSPSDSEQATLPPPPPAFPGPVSLVGRTFGDFELLEEIGRGGMGVVYKAKQISLDRVVALKMLLATHFTHPAALPRFLAEARAAASLSHPNIVSVYQVGACDAGHFFAMEYIDGQSLEAVLRERTVPIPWIVSFLAVVTEAVHFAHTKGIIHRDLKPANLMLDRLRRPVVMDFGIAKFVGKPSGLTQLGAAIGTPAYMPPEQAGEDLSQVGPRSDVYSLGAILYALLAGRPPYEEGTPLQTILKVIAPEPPPPPRDFRPKVPPALEEICMTCLAKRPADRYPSARALALELRRFRAESATRQVSTAVRSTLPAVVLVGQETGKSIRLFNQTTVIGRASDCDVVLKASDVSKRHCRIHIEGDEVVIEDLGSANGTCVNGQPVKRARLCDGDELEVAGHVFRVRVPAPPRQR